MMPARMKLTAVVVTTQSSGLALTYGTLSA
jgi:hypothetical protein